MKDFNVRQQCLPEVRDKENSGRETLGKFFYDLAKITFTALVAGNLVSLFVLGENGVLDSAGYRCYFDFIAFIHRFQSH